MPVATERGTLVLAIDCLLIASTGNATTGATGLHLMAFVSLTNASNFLRLTP
jgi:hypothetical protein